MTVLDLNDVPPLAEIATTSAMRELTVEELDAVGGALHMGNSMLGFSITKDGLTVCVLGHCGTIWFS